MMPPHNAITEPLAPADELTIEDAERFIARSEFFWWDGPKLAPKAHCALFTRLYTVGAFVFFSFAVISHLVFDQSRWVWYSAIGCAYFLAWRGCRHYRVLRLFERAGPQTFDELRKIAEMKNSRRA